jgi:selenocysteine lyase/cysteine desulfurase
VGFLYAAQRAQEQVRHLVVGWGYSKDGTTADGTGRLLMKGKPYLWGIEDWGTFSMPEFVATGEAVRFQQEIGPERIAARGRQLAAHLRRRVADLGWGQLISPSHPDMACSISTFRLSGFGDMNLAAALFDRHKITVPVSRQGDAHRIRVSTHIYNTFAELDRLVEALEQLRAETAMPHS